MKDVRTKLTDSEQFATNVVGLNTNADHFAMRDDINDIIQREKIYKHNDMVDEYVERIKKHVESYKESVEQIEFDFNRVQIKPMFNRILLTKFDANPFQRIKVESGIVTDLGGMTPEDYNKDTGKMEQHEQRIVVGIVQEVGPDCKYIKRGDAIFFDEISARPVPYFKQGYWCMNEQQIIAVVNESLEDRFNEIKFNEKQNS